VEPETVAVEPEPVVEWLKASLEDKKIGKMGKMSKKELKKSRKSRLSVEVPPVEAPPTRRSSTYWYILPIGIFEVLHVQTVAESSVISPMLPQKGILTLSIPHNDLRGLSQVSSIPWAYVSNVLLVSVGVRRLTLLLTVRPFGPCGGFYHSVLFSVRSFIPCSIFFTAPCFWLTVIGTL
jgi:hypothetical protein